MCVLTVSTASLRNSFPVLKFLTALIFNRSQFFNAFVNVPYYTYITLTTAAIYSNRNTSQTCAGYQVRLLQGVVGYLNMNMLIKPVGHIHKQHTLCTAGQTSDDTVICKVDTTKQTTI